MTDYYTDNEFATSKFEVELKEEKEIDIQAIEELDARIGPNLTDMQATKINEVIKAIKQLDKKIKE